jgi:hypothetical protein
MWNPLKPRGFYHIIILTVQNTGKCREVEVMKSVFKKNRRKRSYSFSDGMGSVPPHIHTSTEFLPQDEVFVESDGTICAAELGRVKRRFFDRFRRV